MSTSSVEQAIAELHRVGQPYLAAAVEQMVTTVVFMQRKLNEASTIIDLLKAGRNPDVERLTAKLDDSHRACGALVKECEAARLDAQEARKLALEDAAKLCDVLAMRYHRVGEGLGDEGCQVCANSIRSLDKVPSVRALIESPVNEGSKDSAGSFGLPSPHTKDTVNE